MDSGTRRLRRNRRSDSGRIGVGGTENFYELVAEFSYDWEAWVNLDGSFRYVSPSCERITGYPPSAFMEDASFFLSIVHAEDRPAMSRHFSRVGIDDWKMDRCEFRIVTATGETRWIHHVCGPAFSPDGLNIGRRSSNQDVTERKRAELELEQQRK